MATGIITAICLILSAIIGVWKMAGRRNEYRRKMADEARKKLDDAKKNDSPSDFLDSFGRVR